MFGYIKPFKPELRVAEFDTYQAVYCGLCKELGRTYGFLPRFTLSYDFAFLAMLFSALHDEKPSYCPERCVAHPLHRRMCCQSNEASRFSAAAAMVLFYYKLRDNFRDSKLGGKLLVLPLWPFAARCRRKAMRLYPKLDPIVSTMMLEQQSIELSGDRRVDAACEPTAKCMSMLCRLLAPETRQEDDLARFGYLLGRWIYMMDALDDLEDDLKSGNYNPFLSGEQSGHAAADRLPLLRRESAFSLNLTAAEMAHAYGQLRIRRFEPILGNIIYLGLRNTMNSVLNKKEKQKNDRSVSGFRR